MIDYLLMYPDDAAREAAFPRPLDEEGNPVTTQSWRTDKRRMMPGEVVLRRAVVDAEGVVTTPEEISTYSWLAIRTKARDPKIEAMTTCMIGTDASLIDTGKFVLFCKMPGATPLGNFEPTYAGSAYPVLAGLTAADLTTMMVSP